MKRLSLWKMQATWPLFFVLMLVYLSYFFMLWTINKARKCFSGCTNTVISAELSWCTGSSCRCVHTRWVFGGYWAQYSNPISTWSSVENRAACIYVFSSAWGLKAKPLINVHWEGKAQYPPRNTLGDSLCHKEEWLGEHLTWLEEGWGREQQQKKECKVTVSSEKRLRVEFHFKVLIYLSWAWHQLKFRMKLGHKLNCKTSWNHRMQSQKILTRLRLA